ncbi:MAG: putative bifunctional diguanylate cyclase/phosphodiesterase, partial [Trebonia sp.]
AAASGEPFAKVVRAGARQTLQVAGGNLAIAVLILWLASTPRALIAVVPLAWLMHRHYRSSRTHQRQEKALERLSMATRGSVTLDEEDAVRHALTDALSLWDPDAAELTLRNPGRDTARVWFLPSGGQISQTETGRQGRGHRPGDHVIERRLAGRDDNLGSLRLIFRRKVELDPDEDRVLDLFVSSLASAIDNARQHKKTDEARAAQIVLTERAEHAANANRLLADRMRNLADQREHDATHDQLTDLANRRALAARIDESITTVDFEHCCCGLLVLDIRDFKTVNNNLGPGAGNQLLLAIADRLRDVVRADDLVAWLGGDEFAVFFRNFATPDGAAAAAAAITKELDAAYNVAGMPVKVEIAAGFAATPWEAPDRDELLRCAEVALQLSKQRRRRGIERYQRIADPASTEQVTLLQELDGALRDGQIVLHYQPKYNLTNGRIVGAEALIRWQHPRRGLLAPSQFMPIVERSAAMTDVTRHVLALAMADNADWARQGYATPVAVNVSARDLYDPDLAATVRTLLEEWQMPAERLTLELTETAAVANLDAVTATLEQLRALRVGLSCDDFGTGYSSLAMLAKYPLSELKIDRSFVAGMLNDRRTQLLIKTAVDAAANFGLTVVAEGIETADQQRALVARGCELGQGFLLSKPLPPFAIGDILRRNLRVA